MFRFKLSLEMSMAVLIMPFVMDYRHVHFICLKKSRITMPDVIPMTDFNLTPVRQSVCSVMGLALRDLRFVCAFHWACDYYF